MPGPSVCMTTEIIAVVGCQRVCVPPGRRRLRILAVMNPTVDPGRSARLRFHRLENLKSQVRKPPACERRSLPQRRLGIARCHVYRHHTHRWDHPHVSRAFWGARVLFPCPCRDRRKYGGVLGSGRSRRRAGRASTGMRVHDAFRPTLADKLAGCRPARQPRSATRPKTVSRLPDRVAAASDVGWWSASANAAPQGAEAL